jgi:hypothetical protein
VLGIGNQMLQYQSDKRHTIALLIDTQRSIILGFGDEQSILSEQLRISLFGL